MFRAFLFIFDNKIKMKKPTLFILIGFILIGIFFSIYLIKFSEKAKVNDKKNTKEKDSVSYWINTSAQADINDSVRYLYINRAKNQNNKVTIDSIKSNNFLKIASESYDLGDSLLFRRSNDEAIRFSTIKHYLNDLAEAHWNYGNFFSDKEVIDSAYYHYQKAYNYFKTTKNDYYSAKMLYNMATILCDINDFTQSELLTFRAITIYKKSDRWLNLYRCYCNLGVIYSGIEDYERAIYYNNKSLEYLKKVDSKKQTSEAFKEMSLNNIGVIYEKNHEYSKAIEYFQKALENDSLKIKDMRLFAMLKDNLAYNKFLNGSKIDLTPDFNYSLKIRDSINHIAGKIINRQHLANYYLSKKDTSSALKQANEAISLSYKANYSRDKLASLLLLSKINKIKSKDYLNDYILLNDSLQKNDRKIRNKFYRISFETDEYIEEAKRLKNQKRLIMILAGAFILVIILLYYARYQFSKNKELLFEREQKLANEEIYRLMLIQQAKLEEGRMQERQRISEELHDGILGKLFGTRMGLSFLEISKNEEINTKQKSYINNLLQIESEIRDISHELKNDVISIKDDFIKIIENFLHTQSEISNFTYAINNDYNIYWDEIDERIKINIYRILQESLNNVLKHANASKFDVGFVLKKDELLFTINDNGVGFKVNKRAKGIGIKNMNSRVLAIGGVFLLNSDIGKGTSIIITIPLIYNKYEN